MTTDFRENTRPATLAMQPNKGESRVEGQSYAARIDDALDRLRASAAWLDLARMNASAIVPEIDAAVAEFEQWVFRFARLDERVRAPSNKPALGTSALRSVLADAITSMARTGSRKYELEQHFLPTLIKHSAPEHADVLCREAMLSNGRQTAAAGGSVKGFLLHDTQLSAILSARGVLCWLGSNADQNAHLGRPGETYVRVVNLRALDSAAALSTWASSAPGFGRPCSFCLIDESEHGSEVVPIEPEGATKRSGLVVHRQCAPHYVSAVHRSQALRVAS